MIKTCALAAAAATAFVLTLPATASAAPKDTTKNNPVNAAPAEAATTTEFSSHRRRYRHVHRHYAPRYYGYRPYYRAYPSYGYYRPYRAYPYRYGYWGRPGVSFGFSF